MRLIFKHPDGGRPKMLFPRVGEWTSGDTKDIEDSKARFLLEKFGDFFFPAEKERPAPIFPVEKEKPIAKGKKQKAENEFREDIEKASEKIEEFYKFEDEGGED